MAFVQMDPQALITFLELKRFKRVVAGGELCYVFSHLRYRWVLIKVWTSIPADGRQARGCGQDAIRITVAYEGDEPTGIRGKQGLTSFGLYKAKRVFRTGSQEAIIDRVHERIREAYAFANEWLRQHWAEIPH